MDELFDSDLKLAYDPVHSPFLEKGNEKDLSNLRRMKANCPSFDVCVDWAQYYKNVSVFLSDYVFQIQSAIGLHVGENGEPLLCRIDDGVFFNTQSVMLMFYGEPLLNRINDIFGRVVEAGLYKFWLSELMDYYKRQVEQKAIVNPLDEYYSFNLHHLQPAFYLVLMGLCLSFFCFAIELFCYSLLHKRS
jgi:hypothetical protein